MSAGILDKLKIKPNPEKNEEGIEVKFNITQQDNDKVILHTKIIQKTDINSEEREKLLKNLIKVYSQYSHLQEL